jgi:hypothetical protein
LETLISVSKEQFNLFAKDKDGGVYGLVHLCNKWRTDLKLNYARGKIVEGIGTGIILVIALIVFVEICRFFRWIMKLPREIDDLKRRVSNIEEVIKNQNR